MGKFSVLWQWSNTSAGSKPNWWRKLARSASCFKLFSFFSISNQHSIWGGCSLSASCQSRGNIVLPPKSDLSKMKTTFECLIYREGFWAISIFCFYSLKPNCIHPIPDVGKLTVFGIVWVVWHSLEVSYLDHYAFERDDDYDVLLWEWKNEILKTYQCYFRPSQVPRVKFDEDPLSNYYRTCFIMFFFCKSSDFSCDKPLP